MANEMSKTAKADRDRIKVKEDYELRHWSHKFNVSEQVLRAAVKKVGPMGKDVAKELGKSW